MYLFRPLGLFLILMVNGRQNLPYSGVRTRINEMAEKICEPEKISKSSDSIILLYINGS